MLKEFRDFIAKGNVLDLAVAVIIGAAFAAVIESMVTNILTPIVGAIFGGTDFAGIGLTIGNARIGIGLFLDAVINFLIVAFLLFLIIRSFKMVKDRMTRPATLAVTTKECPYCISTIPLKATRCPNCTSDLSNI